MRAAALGAVTHAQSALQCASDGQYLTSASRGTRRARAAVPGNPERALVSAHRPPTGTEFGARLRGIPYQRRAGSEGMKKKAPAV